VLPAVSVAEMSEDHGAEWSDEETDTERGERQQAGGEGSWVGKNNGPSTSTAVVP
jgi:hypothetical protein